MADLFSSRYSFFSEVPIPDHLEILLSEKETALFAVKTVRDTAVFTDKRILIADKQGITGKKVEYATVPYKSIISYSIETAGSFDLDSEIKIYLSGGTVIQLEFLKGKRMSDLLFKVYNTITEYVIS